MNSRGTIGIVRPPAGNRVDGNRTTAERWGAILETLGWNVFHTESWDGRACEVLVVLHGRKGHDSVLRFHRAHPDHPLIVCGTGTDIYTDVVAAEGDEAEESFRCATRVIVLQPMALESLPADVRPRACVLHQSVERPSRPVPKVQGCFQVLFLANIRPVKDPLTAARAATLLPVDTDIRVVHAGSAIDERLASELEHIARECPAFESRGALPREEALELLGSSHALLNTSRHEGGANAISEALAYGVPVLCTDIPGSLGMLGSAYPARFPVGDVQALTGLLQRLRTDDAFRQEVDEACAERAWLTDPRTELEGWRTLLADLIGDPS